MALREIAFITCSYDTGFESVVSQVVARVQQIEAQLSELEGVEGSLTIANDSPDPERFANDVNSAFGSFPDDIRHRLHLVPVAGSAGQAWGQKGRALRTAMHAALQRRPELVVYINLNLKVPVADAVSGIERVLDRGWDVGVGSRADADGGARVGIGRLGWLKSMVFSGAARAILPPLYRFEDQNAPVKILRPQVARAIVAQAQVDGAFFDCEWLMIALEHDMVVGRFPVTWTQRSGSRPPWNLVASSLRDLMRTRARWQAGRFRPRGP